MYLFSNFCCSLKLCDFIMQRSCFFLKALMNLNVFLLLALPIKPHIVENKDLKWKTLGWSIALGKSWQSVQKYNWFIFLSIFNSQDTELLSPGIIINSISPSSPSLEGSRHLSRSNIDIPRSSGPDDPKKQLPRKRSDSSTYELDTIKQHQAFLSRWTREKHELSEEL